MNDTSSLVAPVAETRDLIPLSAGQQALWFIYRDAPESAAYNTALLLRFETGLDPARLRLVVTKLTGRHGILKSRLCEKDGVPYQWVDHRREIEFCLRDVAGPDGAVLDEAAVMEEVYRISKKPFVLEEGVFRVDVFPGADKGSLVLLGLHHIAGDARSLAILGQELCDLYSAEIQGRAAELPPPTSDYTDFIRWEKERLESATGEKTAAYWQRQLAGKPAILQLPTDRPRPRKQTFNGASLRFTMPDTGGLRELARRERCSLFSLLLTAFQVLLHRYTGQEDILVGVPTSTVRGRAAFDDMVGYLVCPMVVHAGFPKETPASFREKAAQTQRQVLSGLYHQPYPFPQLLEQLEIVRDQSYPPLVQAFLAYETIGLIPKRFEADGVLARNIPIAQMEGQFDVSLTFEDDDETLTGILSYNADLFFPETAHRMTEHLQKLLEGVAVQPDRDIRALPMLTRKEIQCLLDWCGAKTDYPGSESIVGLFEQQAEQTPDAVALVHESEQLTYSRLNHCANQLARHLMELMDRYPVKSVKSGNPNTQYPLIGISVDRSFEMIIGLLAILKAGAGYLPVDPDYPAERIRYMLEDSEARLLLTSTGFKARFNGHMPEDRLVCLDDIDLLSLSADNPAVRCESTDAAYVNYTSGSTGQPKGVLIPHQAVVRLVKDTNYATLDSEQVFLQYAPLSFDAATLEIWGPLLNGGRLVMMPPGQKDLASLAAVLAREKISLLFLTTSLFNLLMDEHPEALGGVKQLFTGGEVMSVPHIEKALRLLPDTRLANVYGPTENTTFTTFYPIKGQVNEGGVPIGKPIANTEVFILGPDLKPVPMGVPGELVTAGPGLALCYLNRPDLTAEKFIKVDILGKTRRIYRTGDLARFLPGGDIAFLGRMDTQVKLRGFRIELGEVESALCRMPGVKDAVVILHDRDGDKKLVAYLTPKDAPGGELSLSPAGLRGGLKQQLPDYMIPAHFVVLDKLPLTVSGKADLKALPAPRQNDRAGEQPASPTEAVLAGLWVDILGCDTVHRQDSFFDLGGHSLSATRIIARIRDHFQVELQVSTVFDHPRLDELASAIDAARGKPLLAPIQAQTEDTDNSLSFAQQRLWFLNQLTGNDSAVYNIPLAFELSGPLDVESLRRSLHWLILRHESLRSSFPNRSGKAAVRIRPETEIDEAVLRVHDLTGIPAEDLDEDIRNRAHNHACRPFDLNRGPLFRADLLLCPEQASGQRWVLLLNMHHIISDGWSLGVFMRELRCAYIDFSRGREPDLPPLPVQYSDYAAWQREWLKGEELARQINYWRRQLANAPERLDLPTDTPRPARQSFRGGHRMHQLSGELVKKLTQLSRERNATLFMTLLSAFYILLSRYSRMDDLCVGTPIANRTNSDTHDTIGFFVNSLVLRGRLRPDMRFSELLQDTRETCLSAYAHQDVPFEMLVEKLAPARSLGHSPLFQVMLGFRNDDPMEPDLPGIKSRSLEVAFPFSKFDLSLDIEGREDGLSIRWEYAADLFHASTIRRMAGHFEKLLTAIADTPDRAVGQLSMLTTDDARAWLDWNNTATAYPDDQTVVALFEGQVEKTPDNIAMVCDGEELTYAQLNVKANRLAHYLLGLRRTGGDSDKPIIAISIPRSMEAVIGLLAILKAGGAYLPIDPDYPAHRIRYMLEDSAAPLLITLSRLKDRLLPDGSTGNCLPVCLDDLLDEIDLMELPAENPALPLRVTDPAYINYTSGSTGQPKGVVTPHQAVVRLVRDTNYATLDGAQVFLQYAPLSFDAATLEIWGPFLNGGKLVVMPAGQKALASLAGVLVQEKITILWLTSSLLNIMIEEHPGALQGVTQVLTGGETLSVPHIQKALQLLPDTQLINGYGPTENTTFTCCYPIKNRSYTGSIPIGRPIANTEVFIVDPDLNPVPVGVPGELITAGPGLALGYLNRPDLTAGKFIHTEILGESRRIYRTGDLARVLPGGDIEFIGRMDNQVKLRGFRIEPGEIESALHRIPQVKAAVVALHDTGDDKELVAYLTPKDTPDKAGSLTPANLRELLNQQLPDYMIPAHFIVLDRLPLTDSGKVDRMALPAPRQERIAGEKPATPTETLLAGLWTIILRCDGVTRQDNFFRLGGHSLSATRLISRIRDQFRVELPVSAVFEHPRLAELAKAIDAAGGAPGLPAILPQPADAPPVLSFAQQRLWFLDQLEDNGGTVYNVPMVLELSGRLDLGALRLSIRWLVRRHESLRSSFPTRDGQAMVRIRPGLEKDLTVHDLTAIDPRDLDAEVESRAHSHACCGFDLGKGPLFKVDLLQCSGDRWVLLMNMHHIISDGWSLGVLIRDLSRAYTAFVRGETPHQPPPAIQYGDYAAWQRGWLQGDALKLQEDFWQQQLDGAPELLDLPLDHPRPPVQSYRGDHFCHTLPRGLTKTLNQFSREQNVSLFMTLLTAFYILLFRYSRSDDVCVGTPIANRTHSATDDLVGFFVNTLVLRGRLRPELSLAELLAETRNTCLAAYAHQDISFEMLVEKLAPTRSLSHSPLFQVMFGLQNTDPVSPELPGLDVRQVPVDYPVAKFDLSLSIEEQDGTLNCGWEFATDLFNESTIRRMAVQYEHLLREMTADPAPDHLARPVSSLSLLTSGDTETLGSWNDTSDRIDGEDLSQPTVIDLFEHQVETAPDNIALISDTVQLTYRQLNDAANRLAHYINHHQGEHARKKKGQHRLVAVCVERSPEMVIGMLAILKSGSAFVAVDPTYPQARIRHILADSGVSLVLTQTALTSLLPLDELEQACTALCMDDTDFADRSTENPRISRDPDDLAYVIYTSGTTGVPKGVMIQHAALAGYIRMVIRDYSMTRDDRVLQFSSPSFDPVVEEIHMTLLSGAALCLRTEEMIGSTEAFLRTCARQELTVLVLPTAFWHSLLTDMETVRKLWPERIRFVVIGGEAVSPGKAMQWLEQFGNFPVLLNSYGPSEATVAATGFRISEAGTEGLESIQSIPIGRPLADTRIYIMDDQLRPQPPGIPGELCIAGGGLALGYFKRPELTAEKFIETKVLGEQERIYRTGDLARWLDDGNIEFLGRIDHQVKLRGFRIEPGEIESLLSRHPAVMEAVVVLTGDGENKQLVAYVAVDHDPEDNGPEAEEASLTDKLLAHLKAHLPAYMVPAHVVLLGALPLTPNGKVDREKLPVPDMSAVNPHYETPATPAEAVVADIWTELLGMEKVGRHDNFFALGGHSLLVVQLVNRLQSLFEVRMVVRELFEAPTVAGITAKLLENEPQKGQVDTIAQLQQEINAMSEEEIRAALSDTDE
ncbi:MAG: amino acid adenylation domain-containing protein [Desulfobacterales bacterium]|nr:amino acid adenylation domain-containing protein [Desulfobacterales bacterium]